MSFFGVFDCRRRRIRIVRRLKIRGVLNLVSDAKFIDLAAKKVSQGIVPDAQVYFRTSSIFERSAADDMNDAFTIEKDVVDALPVALLTIPIDLQVMPSADFDFRGFGRAFVLWRVPML